MRFRNSYCATDTNWKRVLYRHVSGANRFESRPEHRLFSGSFWLSPVPSLKCRDTTFNWAMTASFHILCNSLFSDYPNLHCYVGSSKPHARARVFVCTATRLSSDRLCIDSHVPVIWPIVYIQLRPCHLTDCVQTATRLSSDWLCTESYVSVTWPTVYRELRVCHVTDCVQTATRLSPDRLCTESYAPVIWPTATACTRYSANSFVSLFYILRTNQLLMSCAEMLS